MNKGLTLLLGILLLTVATAGIAGDRHNGKSGHGYNDPVVVPAMGFSAEFTGHSVTMQWKRYLRDDLKFYKVVKSESNPDPVYPEDGYIFYSGNPADTAFEDTKIAPGTWHYRLCIVTQGGDRWVSPVVTVEIESGGGKVPDASDFQ